MNINKELNDAYTKITALEEEINILLEVIEERQPVKEDKPFPKSNRQLIKWLVKSDPRDWYKVNKAFVVNEYSNRNTGGSRTHAGWFHKPTNMLVSYFVDKWYVYDRHKPKFYVGDWNSSHAVRPKVSLRYTRKLNKFIDAITIGCNFRDN